MSTTIQSSIALPSVPKGYKAPSFSPLSAPSTSQLFPAGPAFLSHARRTLNQRSFAEDDRLIAEELAKNGGTVVEEDDADAGLGDEQEEKSLLQQDPKLWKEQDHYAVLGLQHLRYKATEEQIKKANRRKVLRHHPDKKASSGGEANDDSFFKCIAKATETLSNPEKRRQFDSVDAEAEVDPPAREDVNDENFIDLFAPVFESEGRFSVKQPVPSLGDKDTPKKDVESFYDFWYNIDSWRSFEYNDKDAAEGADSRDEKRHQEKKNKAERAKAKKEDITRVRTLVDMALALDPRIKAFKAADKAARAAKKGGPAAVDPKVAEAEKKAAEEAAAAKAAEEQKQAADDKATREAAKKAREAAKKNVKKDKKAITAIVTSNNYFVAAGTSPAASIVEGQFAELDVIFEKLEPEVIGELKKEMEAAKGPEAIKAVVVKFAGQVEGGKFVQFA